MNKVILMGRLTRDPEVRYTQSSTPTAVARFGLAVRRKGAKEGQQDTDFFNLVAFGKSAEFAEKYFKKGQLISVVGRLQVNNWEDQQKVKHTSVDVVIEEQYFAGSKSSGDSTPNNAPGPIDPSQFDQDDDLPF